ncbi:MAG: ammonium transporter, partial [Gammaproteobacteria bacterium]|nr:ammonium transporter [Gammaproteobacteria bacterium]
HGTCGIWGILAVLFSNADATILGQLTGIVGIFVWVFVASLIVWGILKATVGIRVSEEDEMAGVDFSETGIEAYPEFAQA